MSHSDAHVENPVQQTERPAAPFSAADYQSGATGGMRQNDNSAASSSADQHLPDGNALLAQMQSDPERMQSVQRNSAEARKMFPDTAGSDDVNSPTNAAYRYLMDKECVDNYSASAANDKQILEKASPGSTQKLDEIVNKRAKQGPAPGSHCAVPMS